MAELAPELSVDSFRKWSTTQLLLGADRSDPLIRVLCERFELQLDAVKRDRVRHNEFKRELTALLGMI